MRNTESLLLYVHVQDAQYHNQFGATRTIEIVVHFVDVASSLCELYSYCVHTAIDLLYVLLYRVTCAVSTCTNKDEKLISLSMSYNWSLHRNKTR